MLTAAPVNFIFSMYIETKIIMQGLVYATRSDGPHQQVESRLSRLELVTELQHIIQTYYIDSNLTAGPSDVRDV